MYKAKIYLDDYTLQYLNSFGDLNTVINHCIDMAMQDNALWMQDDPIPPRENADHQVRVIVNNPAYEQYREAMGNNAKETSLRRLLIYIAMYELIDADKLPKMQTYDTIKAELGALVTRMINLASRAPNREWSKSLLNAIKELKEYL